MTDRSTIHRIAFSRIKGINPSVAEKILQHVDTEEAFFNLSAQELSSRMPHLPAAMMAGSYRRTLVEAAETELSFMQKSGIRPVYFTDSAYPARLAECDDAPLLLYSTSFNKG